MAIFVRADHPQAPPGLGKLIAVNGTQATVEYFNSPTDDPLILTFDTKLLSRHDVPTQTRAYWCDRSAFVWRVGRVIEGFRTETNVTFLRPNSAFAGTGRSPIRLPISPILSARHLCSPMQEARSQER